MISKVLKHSHYVFHFSDDLQQNRPPNLTRYIPPVRNPGVVQQCTVDISSELAAALGLQPIVQPATPSTTQQLVSLQQQGLAPQAQSFLPPQTIQPTQGLPQQITDFPQLQRYIFAQGVHIKYVPKGNNPPHGPPF